MKVLSLLLVLVSVVACKKSVSHVNATGSEAPVPPNEAVDKGVPKKPEAVVGVLTKTVTFTNVEFADNVFVGVEKAAAKKVKKGTEVYCVIFDGSLRLCYLADKEFLRANWQAWVEPSQIDISATTPYAIPPVSNVTVRERVTGADAVAGWNGSVDFVWEPGEHLYCDPVYGQRFVCMQALTGVPVLFSIKKKKLFKEFLLPKSFDEYRAKISKKNVLDAIEANRKQFLAESQDAAAMEGCLATGKSLKWTSLMQEYFCSLPELRRYPHYADIFSAERRCFLDAYRGDEVRAEAKAKGNYEKAAYYCLNQDDFAWVRASRQEAVFFAVMVDQKF